MHTKFSSALFNDPQTITCKDKIVQALAVYNHVIASPIEDLRYQDELLKNATFHLFALGCMDFNMYQAEYEKIFKKLIIYFKAEIESPKLQQHARYKLLSEHTKNNYLKDEIPFIKQKQLMQEKFFNLVHCLSRTICSEIKKQKYINSNFDIISFINSSDIIFLIMLFPKEKEKIKLIYNDILNIFPFILPQDTEKFHKRIGGLFVLMGENEFFRKASNDKDDKLIFKTSIFFNSPVMEALSGTKKQGFLLDLVDELTEIDTLQSLVMAYYYLEYYVHYFVDFGPSVEVMIRDNPMFKRSMRCLYIQQWFKKTFPEETRQTHDVLILLGKKFANREELNYPESS